MDFCRHSVSAWFLATSTCLQSLIPSVMLRAVDKEMETETETGSTILTRSLRQATVRRS
jgi:hypothetical protein